MMVSVQVGTTGIGSKIWRHRVLLLCALLFLSVGPVVAVPQAAAETMAQQQLFQISQQELNSALLEFADTAGVQLVFDMILPWSRAKPLKD